MNQRKYEDNPDSTFTPLPTNITPLGIELDPETGVDLSNTENKKSEWWTCGGVEYGLNKLEKNITKLGKKANKMNSEFYIIIMPWPDTLNFGQTKFNWENFNNNLCIKASCSKLINLFWPGPLTLILEKKKTSSISPLVSNSMSFIGCRIPNNKTAKSLLNLLNVPIAAPSANIAPPYSQFY